MSDTAVYALPRFDPIELPAGDDLDTPAAVVDRTRLIENIERMQGLMDERGIALRPHVKTHSSSVVARLQLERGAVGLTAGTVRMATALAAAGFQDIFVAAPSWPSRAEVARVRRLNDETHFTLAIDSVSAAEGFGKALAGSSKRLRVLIEIDSGEGRSGVRPEGVLEVAEAARRAGLWIGGAFTHGGHSYAGPGAAGSAAKDEVAMLAAARDALGAGGFDAETLSAGSTPTVRRSSVPPVTEERPGTYVFNDRQQVGLGGATIEQVAFAIAATVTSTAVPGQVILNCGAKALTKDKAAWLDGFGALPAYPDARIARLFDFHAVVEFPDGGARPAQGEVVAVVPNHVCPVVNVARELTVISAGEVVDHWAIDARG